MDAEENQRQVSLRARSPWKSQKRRFPHSLSRGGLRTAQSQSQNQNQEGVRWKSGNPKPGFPLSHRTGSLRRKDGDAVVVSGTRQEARTSERRPSGGRFAPAFRL